MIDEKAATRAEEVDEPPAADVHQTVRDEERRIEERLDLVRDRDVALDRRDRPRQRLAVEIADRDRGAHEHRDAPARRLRARRSDDVDRQ